MRARDRVADFCDEHDLHGEPAYRVLDLAAEVGEIAGDAAESAEYGAEPDGIDVSGDELGDAFFSLLAVADAFDGRRGGSGDVAGEVRTATRRERGCGVGGRGPGRRGACLVAVRRVSVTE
jgi:hypothetical protein